MEQYKKYLLKGIININDYNMDMVYPVFYRDGLFYFQKIKDHKIEGFELIKNIKLLEKIKIFEKGLTNNLINKSYSIGSNAMYAFQTDEYDVFVSSIDGFLSFLKTMKVNDRLLQLSIKQFINRNETPKQKIKINK